MIYYIAHKGTDPLYFEEIENLKSALKISLGMLEAEHSDGFQFDIQIGCAKTVEEASVKIGRSKGEVAELKEAGE